MNFKAILDKVFEKIKNTSDKNKKRIAFKNLEECIIKNPIYQHQFELMTDLQENKGKIKNNVQLENFILKIRNKNIKFILENKVTSLKVWQENKKLLEYYNINPNEVIPSILDKAIDINGENKLNEAAIKSFLGKVKIIEKNKAKTNHLKESFSHIIKNKSTKDLTINFKIVRFFAEALNNQDKNFIFESLIKLRTMQKTNFQETVSKLYKLRLITEKLIKEFQYDDDETEKHSPSKKVKLPDLENIKNIEVITPKNYKDPEKIIIYFEVPFYPIGARWAELNASAIDLKKKLNNLGKYFIENYIVKAGKTDLFNTKGYVWNVLMRETGFKLGVPSAGKVTLYINARPGKGHTWPEYWESVGDILNKFSAELGEIFPEELNPIAQKKAIADKDPNRIRAKKTPRDQSKNQKVRKKEKMASFDNDEFGGFF